MKFYFAAMALLATAVTLVSAKNSPLSKFSYRSIDGQQEDPRGAANATLLRMAECAYPGDGCSGDTMVRTPNARMVSNVVAKTTESTPNALGRSDMLWAWGQFLDHDISLTEGKHPDHPIMSPGCDDGTDEICMIPFSRSIHREKEGVREQINEITSFIDASMVYGSDEKRAHALRTGEDGRLKMQNGNKLLPLNTEGLPNAMPSEHSKPEDFFLAGDIRANEQLGLMALHTLFVREHNRLVKKLKSAYPSATDEELYQMGRKLVGAEIQKITYDEFLPMLLGPNEAPNKEDYMYDADVNPATATEFSTAAFRVGHTMLSPQLLMARRAGEKWKIVGESDLVELFFPTHLLMNQRLDIDEIICGLCVQKAQEVDTKVIEAVRTFLFAPPSVPGAVGGDLAALNIQRGRDHGIPSYTKLRKALGLNEVMDWDGFEEAVRGELSAAYNDTVQDVDAWVGGLAEPHLEGSMVGEMFSYIIKDQFMRLMNGDKFFFWGDKDLQDPVIKQVLDVNQVTLANIISWNTIVNNNFKDNVFQAAK